MLKQLAMANTPPFLSPVLTHSTRSAFIEACKRQEDRYVPRGRTDVNGEGGASIAAREGEKGDEDAEREREEERE